MCFKLNLTELRTILPRRALGVLSILAGSAFSLISPGSLALDYDIGFDSGNDIGSQVVCSGNCPTITTQYAREGRGAMRSYLNRKNSKTSDRTEVKFPGGSNGPQKMKFGRDYWIGFSTMLPRNWSHLKTGGEMLAQIHGTLNKATGVSGVPFEIRPKNGDWRIITRGQNMTNKVYTLNSVYEDVGRWVDWVIHYRPSYNSNGIIRVWKDGALVVNQTDRRTAYKSDIGPYWKMGLYLPWKDRNCCDGDPVDRVVYHDALRIASGAQAGYLDVAPRGESTIGQGSESTKPEPEPAPESEPAPEPDSGSTEPAQELIDSYVGFVNLANRDSVQGQVDIVIDAQDPDGIRYVAFWVEGERVGKLSSPPYNFVFDSRPYAGTSRLRLKAYAFDNKGNVMKEVSRVNVSR
jgi:hypothetical protein